MKLPLIPVLVGAIVLRGSTADISAEWFAGSARIKITPDSPVGMSGYAGRTDLFKSIVHDLWAKALVLEDSTGSRFAIITTDLSGIYADLAAEIYQEIEDETSIQQKNILLTWSHTHSGPRLSRDRESSTKMADSESRKTADYTNRLIKSVVHVVELASLYCNLQN